MKLFKIFAIAIIITTALVLINPISNGYYSSLQSRTPDEITEFTEEGIASWYGPGFQGRKTANGERFDTHEMTAAHKTLPFNTMLKVTNLENGKSTIVRVNDRGPYAKGRIIDLSYAAKEDLEMGGLAHVKLELYNPDAELPVEIDENEGEVEGFTPENLFEDVIIKKYNDLNSVYTFKKVNFRILTPNKDDALSTVFIKSDDVSHNSSENPIITSSGYTIKLVKTSGEYNTKKLIGELESLNFSTIFVQVVPGNESTIFYVMTGIYSNENDAKDAQKILENYGYVTKIIKIGN